MGCYQEFERSQTLPSGSQLEDMWTRLQNSISFLNILVHENYMENSVSCNFRWTGNSILGWVKTLLSAANLSVIDYCGLAHISEQTWSM